MSKSKYQSINVVENRESRENNSSESAGEMLPPIRDTPRYQSISIAKSSESLDSSDNSSEGNLSYADDCDPEKSLLLKHSPSIPEHPSKTWLLSIYVLLSTLFFGFAIGFSVGFYCFGVSYDEGVESSSSSFKLLSKLRADNTQKIFSAGTPILESIGSTFSRQLMYLNRADAYELLLDSISIGSSTISPFSNDFFLISSGLDVQNNSKYAGAATAVAILNSLRFLRSTGNHADGVEIPVDKAYTPYSYATQSDIFSQCTKNTVVSETGGGAGVDGILTPPYGLNMEQIAKTLRCHLDSTADSGGGTWSVETHYVDPTHMTVGKVKYDLKNALIDSSSRVLVNYDRSLIGQTGGGHWSPVGSYSEKWDAFLILDVAKYKYPPVWIPAERLFSAMATVDDCGSWDYPLAQENLSVEERNGQETAATLITLGCKKQLRGYITVKKET